MPLIVCPHSCHSAERSRKSKTHRTVLTSRGATRIPSLSKRSTTSLNPAKLVFVGPSSMACTTKLAIAGRQGLYQREILGCFHIPSSCLAYCAEKTWEAIFRICHAHCKSGTCGIASQRRRSSASRSPSGAPRLRAQYFGPIQRPHLVRVDVHKRCLFCSRLVLPWCGWRINACSRKSNAGFTLSSSHKK